MCVSLLIAFCWDDFLRLENKRLGNIHVWDRKHFLFISLTFKRAELICPVYISIERKFQKSTQGEEEGRKKKEKKKAHKRKEKRKARFVSLISDL